MRFLIAICAAAVAIGASAHAAPIDGTFSYQGRLTNSGSPVTGIADLTFSLWDADAAGAQIGVDVVLLNVPVEDGLFNVDLDFGVAALNGDERWIEIEARSPAGVGGYTTLAPRQQILGAPYAIQTRGMFVDSNDDVDLVGVMSIDKSTSFLGVNRSSRISNSEYFGVHTPTGDGSYGGMYINTDSPFGRPFYGYSTGDTVRAWSYFNGVSDQWKLDVGGSNRIVVNRTDGRVGIGTGSPAARLDVAQGDMVVTSGGVPQVQLGGIGPGGEVSVYNDNGAETIELLGGTSGNAGSLSMFDTGGNSTVQLLGGTSTGGRMLTFSEDGFLQALIEPDADGEGVFVHFRRINSSNGVTIDGNVSGSGNSSLSVTGTNRSATLNMNNAGTNSVFLPTDAIHNTEILDEPGVAGEAVNGFVSLTGGPPETIVSSTITVPASGWCLVIGTGQANVTHTLGATSACTFGVSDTAGSFPLNQDVGFTINSGSSSGTRSMPVTVQGLFSVAPGANTFYFLGDENSGQWTMNDMQLSVMYFPTAYGTVTPTLLARNGEDDDANAIPMLPMSPDDIYAEQVRAAAFDRSRRDAEADDYAQKITELEARMRAIEAQQGMNDSAPRRASPPTDESQTGTALGHNTTNSR